MDTISHPHRTPTRCIGVDGCPGGWIGVSRQTIRVAPSLAVLIDRFEASVVALDMPIGLPDDRPRDCERLARGLLGRPRAASVFPVPMRAALAGRSHHHASDLNQAACGKRLSAQAYNIMPKIGAVDTLLARQPTLASHIWETHPELSFAAMNGDANGLRSLAASKKSRAGGAQRQALIASHFGAAVFADARSLIDRQDASDDDIGDAFACLFTAERIAAGQHVSLPEPAPHDALGLAMRICY